MATEHQTTPEEEIFWRLYEEKWDMLSKVARTVLTEALSAAYEAKMVHHSFLAPEEYEEAMEKMRLAAADLTDYECGLLAKLWRAALAAAASIDPDDFETLTGFLAPYGSEDPMVCLPVDGYHQEADNVAQELRLQGQYPARKLL